MKGIKMRISPMSNASFGKIATNAVHVVRRQAEGYVANEHAYCAKPHLKMMTEGQLLRLDNLTERASKLEKTLITNSAKDKGGWITEKKGYNRIQSFKHVWEYSFEAVDVLCNDKQKSKSFSVFPRNKYLSSADQALDAFEKAVEYAEKLEDDHSLGEYEKRRCDNRSYTGDTYYNQDRFRTDEEIEMLNSIYKKAL